MDVEQEKLIMDVANKLKELNEIDALEQLIKDNKNEFMFQSNHYRVRKPNPIEKEQANKERMKKYVDMLKDPAYVFKQTLIDLYKTKGIHIDKFDLDVKNLSYQEKNLLNRLYGNEAPNEIESIEKDIYEIRQKQQDLFFQKEDLLKYCIEHKIEEFLKMYLVFQVLEINKDGKWERVYKSYEEFMTSTEELLQAKAAQIFALIADNEII